MFCHWCSPSSSLLQKFLCAQRREELNCGSGGRMLPHLAAARISTAVKRRCFRGATSLREMSSSLWTSIIPTDRMFRQQLVDRLREVTPSHDPILLYFCGQYVELQKARWVQLFLVLHTAAVLPHRYGTYRKVLRSIHFTSRAGVLVCFSHMTHNFRRCPAVTALALHDISTCIAWMICTEVMSTCI